jgi:hypothetical protein
MRLLSKQFCELTLLHLLTSASGTRPTASATQQLGLLCWGIADLKLNDADGPSPWVCENSERALTEGNLALPASRSRSFYAFRRPEPFDTAKTLTGHSGGVLFVVQHFP